MEFGNPDNAEAPLLDNIFTKKTKKIVQVGLSEIVIDWQPEAASQLPPSE